MRNARTALILFSFALFAGCAGTTVEPRDDELLIKASALTKVAAALESAVKFKDAPPQLSEAELLHYATTHDPDLLQPFQGYVLRARRVGDMTSVLLCTKDGQSALIEDSGCTARSDLHLWDRSPPVTCVFQLDLAAVCTR